MAEAAAASPRKEARRAAILAAARKIFARDGYEKAKVTEIAAEVGVVEGTVFHYFGSKRKLVQSAIVEFYQEISQRQEEALAQVDGAGNKLRTLIRQHLQVMVENADFCAVLLKEARNVQDDLNADVQASNRGYTAVLKDIHQEGVAQGEFCPDVPWWLLRNTIYGAIEHIVWQHLLENREIDLDETCEQLSNLVYRGLSPRPKLGDPAEIEKAIQTLQRLR